MMNVCVHDIFHGHLDIRTFFLFLFGSQRCGMQCIMYHILVLLCFTVAPSYVMLSIVIYILWYPIFYILCTVAGVVLGTGTRVPGSLPDTRVPGQDPGTR